MRAISRRQPGIERIAQCVTYDTKCQNCQADSSAWEKGGGTERVLRGGAFGSSSLPEYGYDLLRTAARNKGEPTEVSIDRGMRCVR